MKNLIMILIIATVMINLTACTGTGDKPISSTKTVPDANVEIKTQKKENAQAELTDIYWNTYTTVMDTEMTIVTGIVKNTGDVVIKLDDASGSIYDTSGVVIGNNTESFSPEVIAPGENAYVAVSIQDTVKKEEISDAKIQFAFEKTDELPVKVNAINDSGKSNKSDGYKVTGELENPGEERIEDVRVAGLFYDKDGNLIDVDRGYPKPDAIPPHDTISYYVTPSYSYQGKLVTDYKVIGFSLLY